MAALTAWIADYTYIRPNGVTETIHLSDTPILPFPHDDPDRPNVGYRAKLDGPPAYAWGTHADLSRLSGDVGAGVLGILNGDQAYSYLAGCAPVSLHVRRGREGLYWAEWTPVLTARPEAPQPQLSARQAGKVTVPLYDLRGALADEVIPTRYGGTNIGAIGYDCAPDAGKGDPIPLCIGRPLNVPGKIVNTQNRVIQIGLAPIGGMGSAYDRGAAAGFASVGDHAGTAFDGVALTGTQLATDPGRGLVKFGGPAVGEVTFDPIGLTVAGDTAATAIRWALQRRGAGTIGATLAAWTPATTIGAFWDAAVTYRELVDLMARSEAAWVLPDPLGCWQVGALDAGAAPAFALGEGDVLDIGIDDAELANPVWQVTVKGRRNHRPAARSAVAPSVWDTDRESFLRDPWRLAVAKAQWVKDRWPDARKVEIETALTEQTAMDALAARLLAFLGPRPVTNEPRRSVWVAVEMTDARLVAAQPGCTVHLGYTREGFADDMLLLGVHLATPGRNAMKLRLFG